MSWKKQRRKKYTRDPTQRIIDICNRKNKSVVVDYFERWLNDYQQLLREFHARVSSQI